MMRKAIIDVGTNSVRLIVADCQADIRVCATAIDMTRLGEGMGEERMIKPQPLERTSRTAAAFAQQARDLGAESIRMTATSAVREALNRQQVSEALTKAAQVSLEILSGVREAELSYAGAAQDFRQCGQALAVLDIGGGSTELVYESGEGLNKASVQAGAVRLQENPALAAQLPQILSALVSKNLPKPLTLIGVGGTITSLAAMEQSLAVYSQERVHGYRLTKESVEHWQRQLTEMSLKERQAIVGLMPKRADIIGWGTLILMETMTLLQVAELTVSDKDLLYGLLAEA